MGPRWIYLFDPWCHWCHAFGATVKALAEAQPELPWMLIPGGLFVEDRKGQRLPREVQARLDAEVRAETGVLFGLPYRDAMEARRLAFDSESAALGFEALRHVAPEHGLHWALAQSDEVWQHGRDPGSPEVLRALAEAKGVDPEAVLAHRETEACRAEVARRFAQARAYQTERLPTLLWAEGSKGVTVAEGASSAEKVLARVETHRRLLV